MSLRSFWFALLCWLVPVIAGSSATPVRAAEQILIFAAASTREAVERVLARPQEGQRIDAIASFASSSTLARQIEAGAPAHLFLSANVAWMDRLTEGTRIVPETRANLLGNSLVLIAPRDSEAGSADLTLGPTAPISRWLGPEAEGGRLAIAQPNAVPAGIYAQQALTALMLWPAVATRLAPTADVRGALTLVARGAAPLGAVYATDAALSDAVRVVGRFPRDAHDPVIYPIALTPLGAATPDAVRLLDIFKSETARRIFTDLGFVAPGPTR